MEVEVRLRPLRDTFLAGRSAEEIGNLTLATTATVFLFIKKQESRVKTGNPESDSLTSNLRIFSFSQTPVFFFFFFSSQARCKKTPGRTFQSLNQDGTLASGGRDALEADFYRL